MNNTIYNDNEEVTIGYYDDIFKGYKELIEEALKQNDIEEANSLTEQLTEIMDWKDTEDLLVLSDGNGMGLIITPYIIWKKNQKNS